MALESLSRLAYEWYVIMSQWSAAVGEPLQQALGAQSVPALSALLLGLLGGLAPCQVTANAGAIAYVTQAGDQPKSLWTAVRDFLGGKAAVYLLLGFLAAIIGLRVPNEAMAVVRKINGPLMILIGLFLAGILHWRGDAGARLTAWVRERAPRRGSPPFWLGVAFSLGFCPTMAVIFFGALVPLIVQAPMGMLLPLIFAVGTALPVILWAMALSAGRRVAAGFTRRVRAADRAVRWIAAAVFILMGLNDTVLYWLV